MQRFLLAMGMTTLLFGLLAVDADAACNTCERTVLLCTECNPYTTATKECVNKQPKCTGCHTVEDTKCSGGGGSKIDDGPYDETRFDFGRGEWMIAKTDDRFAIDSSADLDAAVCGPVGDYVIY